MYDTMDCRGMVGVASSILVLIGSASVGHADLITVDDDDPAADFSTIQDAVDAASDGDVIEVGPGYYFSSAVTPEPVVKIVGKSLEIKAISLSPADTIISGSGLRRVLEWSGPGSDCRFAGFTIQAGRATGGDGGGLLLQDIDIDIVGCVFDGNTADGDGGAIHITSSLPLPPVVDGCRFLRNAAADGGAVHATGGLDVLFCEFEENMATGFGGGLLITGDPTVEPAYSIVQFSTFEDCRGMFGGGMRMDDARVLMSGVEFDRCVAGDEVEEEGWGGGVSVVFGRLEVWQTSFSDCVGAANGGGLDIDRAALEAIDCTFDSCVSYGYGGGLNGYGSATTLILDQCTFQDNIALEIGGGAIGCGEFNVAALDVASLALSNCTFLGNDAWGVGLAVDAPNSVTASDCLFGEQTTGDALLGSVAHMNIEGVGTGSTFERCEFRDGASIDLAGSFRATNVGGLQFVDCRFTDNQTTSVGLGPDAEGAVYISAAPDSEEPISFDGCEFVSNGTCCLAGGFFSGRGGAIWATGRTIDLAFCRFRVNTAESGGSIAATARISNCVISGGSSLGYGGAAYLGAGSSLIDSYITGSADCNYPCLYATGAIEVERCTIRGGVPENFLCGEDPADLAECRFVKGTRVGDTRFCRYQTGPINGVWTDLGGNSFNPGSCNEADIDGNGVVDGADLAAVLGDWGRPCLGCATDVNQDGVVDGGDLAQILAAWG